MSNLALGMVPNHTESNELNKFDESLLYLSVNRGWLLFDSRLHRLSIRYVISSPEIADIPGELTASQALTGHSFQGATNTPGASRRAKESDEARKV